METPEESLEWAIIIILSAVFLAVFFRRRYGPVWPRLRQRLGPRWTLLVKIFQVATLALWILFWVLVSPEQRGELQQYFEENSPWVAR